MLANLSTKSWQLDLTLIAVAAGIPLWACSHEAPPAKMPEPVTETVPEPAAEKAPRLPANLRVSESIRTKCSVPETPAGSPQFDFDEAELRPRGQGILDTIATCMREGSLKDQSVTITGHADPRGSDNYNRELGLERANSAKAYLTSHGANAALLTARSLGEQDATGTDKGSWQLDRRVEIDETDALSQ
jgi:outer membrane protein OmpA-like peptidoglycan-associated protein